MIIDEIIKQLRYVVLTILPRFTIAFAVSMAFDSLLPRATYWNAEHKTLYAIRGD